MLAVETQRQRRLGPGATNKGMVTGHRHTLHVPPAAPVGRAAAGRCPPPGTGGDCGCSGQRGRVPSQTDSWWEGNRLTHAPKINPQGTPLSGGISHSFPHTPCTNSRLTLGDPQLKVCAQWWVTKHQRHEDRRTGRER